MIISIWSLVSDKMFIKMLIEQGMDIARELYLGKDFNM